MSSVYDGANAAFRMYGAALDPQSVTALLGLTPDESCRAGDVIRVGTKSRVAKRGAWSVKSRFHVKSQKLAEHLEWLLARLEPKRKTLLTFNRDDIGAYINCFSMGTSARAPRVSAALRARAKRLGLEITVDHFQHDEAGRPTV